MSEETVEKLGLIVDQADNLITASQIPIDDAMHVSQLRAGLQQIRDKLCAIYIAESVENPWDE